MSYMDMDQVYHTEDVDLINEKERRVRSTYKRRSSEYRFTEMDTTVEEEEI